MTSGRATAIEKLVFFFLLGGYVFYVVPLWHPASAIATAVFLAGVGVIAWAAGRFLAGDSDRIMLVLIALVIVAEVALFTLTPVNH